MIDRTDQPVPTHLEPPIGSRTVAVTAVSHDDGLRVLVDSGGEVVLEPAAARALAAALIEAADQLT